MCFHEIHEFSFFFYSRIVFRKYYLLQSVQFLLRNLAHVYFFRENIIIFTVSPISQEAVFIFVAQQYIISYAISILPLYDAI